MILYICLLPAASFCSYAIRSSGFDSLLIVLRFLFCRGSLRHSTGSWIERPLLLFSNRYQVGIHDVSNQATVRPKVGPVPYQVTDPTGGQTARYDMFQPKIIKRTRIMMTYTAALLLADKRNRNTLKKQAFASSCLRQTTVHPCCHPPHSFLQRIVLPLC